MHNPFTQLLLSFRLSQRNSRICLASLWLYVCMSTNQFRFVWFDGSKHFVTLCSTYLFSWNKLNCLKWQSWQYLVVVFVCIFDSSRHTHQLFTTIDRFPNLNEFFTIKHKAKTTNIHFCYSNISLSWTHISCSSISS